MTTATEEKIPEGKIGIFTGKVFEKEIFDIEKNPIKVGDQLDYDGIAAEVVFIHHERDVHNDFTNKTDHFPPDVVIRTEDGVVVWLEAMKNDDGNWATPLLEVKNA